MKLSRSLAQRGLVVLVALVVLGYLQLSGRDDPPAGSGERDDAVEIAQAFEDQRSNLWVESGGTVERTLQDDREGSAHQRFIVRLSNDHSVLIAHNIDLAPRIPVAQGDSVRFRGEFEWNAKGGVVHWTHHDPSGRREGGWIRHGVRKYE